MIPYTDSYTAQQQILAVDVPPGTEFGIDLNTWNTGEKFKGKFAF
jgi:hypothetical protein